MDNAEKYVPSVKHYKLALDPQCDIDQISERTKRVWEKAFHKLSEAKGNPPLDTNRQHSYDTKDVDASLFEEKEQFQRYDYCSDNESDDEEVSEDHITISEKLRDETTESPKSNKSPAFIDNGNQIMFEQSGTTVNDVIEMVVAYCLRYGDSQKGRKMLIEMFKICAGPKFKNLNLSNYKLSKIFDPPPHVTTYHFYCNNCFEKVVHSSSKSEIKGQTSLCEHCNSNLLIKLSNPNYFVINNLEYQLQTLFKNKEILKYFLENSVKETCSIDNTTLSDVSSSVLYQRTIEKHSATFTYTISTDGAPLFNVSKRSFWPLQIILNELPVKLRFKFVLLAGVMIVTTEPKPNLMNLFLGEFIRQANLIHSKGIKIKLLNENREIILQFTPIIIVADSVARPILQNRLQYNGNFGCSYCYQRGTYLNHSMRYPFQEIEPELRSHDSHMRDIGQIKGPGSSFQGVKGKSAFIELSNIDMCWSFALDYLHNAVFGTTEQVWNLWFKLLTVQERKLIDNLLLYQQPPRELFRLTLKISNKSVWKATNWKSWLLYFSLPICSPFIQDHDHLDMLENFALFRNSIFTMLKLKITQDELNTCEQNMLQFTAEYENLYGPENVTFNVHASNHIPLSEKMSGPLWATSAFPFERNIHFIKQTINGPKSVEQQMSTKSLNLLKYKIRPPNNNVSEIAQNYIKAIFSSETCTKSTVRRGKITFFRPDPKNIFESVQEKEFERCVFQNLTFSSTKYLKSKRWNDTVIELKNGEFVQITKICLRPDDSCSFYVKKIIVAPYFVGNIQIVGMWIVRGNDNHENVSVAEIHSKAVVIELVSTQLVCSIPNTVEAQ
ncbi:uncharacterized protein LOC127286849 isoform X2 [Leptopilina boulardi]|nr:uncharacterized protein LOC127286849 isoform X2 [Leptopilina boulardi]